jgi:hypothetical protein
MTALGANRTDGTSSSPTRFSFDHDAAETPNDMTQRSWIRRAWHYIVDRPLI